MYDVYGNLIGTFYNVHNDQVSQIYDVDGNPLINQRVITFEDDFDGQSLDESKWSYELGICRPSNNELQTYRRRNVTVEDGCLVLTAKRESYNTKDWTSGSITTEGKFNQRYGRWEAKIKMPAVAGAFAAFWMKGANQINHYDEDGVRTIDGVQWPQCGEFDITETTPGDTNVAKSNMWTYSGRSLGRGVSAFINIADWNIYACEWTPEYIAVFLNDVEFKRYVFSSYESSEIQAYHLPFFAIINLAVGSHGGTPSSELNEMKMYVDWVRVYEPLA